MPDDLVEWLLPCGKEFGPLLPVNFRRKRWALCRDTNWKKWPDYVLRHSYGSYHLAKHRNAALTAEQMGHKNARMLYVHYREVVKEVSDIEEFWKLTPERSPRDSSGRGGLSRTSSCANSKGVCHEPGAGRSRLPVWAVGKRREGDVPSLRVFFWT
jgi:hypothetical protein